MSRSPFGEHELALLRREVEAELSPGRFAHTLGVEQMTARLCALLCPEESVALSAAALLHDITKEKSNAWHLAVFSRHGVLLRPDEVASPKIWHGISASLILPERYSRFALPVVVSAVRWHTTGHAGMTLQEAILYLADCIEEGRTYPACVALRNRFFDAAPERMEVPCRKAHLAQILRESLAGTLASLAAGNAPISADSRAALDWLNREESPFERK